MTNKKAQEILSRFLEVKGVKDQNFKDFVVTKSQFREKVKSLTDNEKKIIFKDLQKPLTDKEMVSLYDRFDKREKTEDISDLQKMLNEQFKPEDSKEDFEEAISEASDENPINADEVFGDRPLSQDPDEEVPVQKDGKDNGNDDEGNGDEENDSEDGSDGEDKGDSDADEGDQNDEEGDGEDDSDGEDGGDSDNEKDSKDEQDTLERQIAILRSQNIRIDTIRDGLSDQFRAKINQIEDFNDFQIRMMEQAIEFEKSHSTIDQIPYEFRNVAESVVQASEKIFKKNILSKDVTKRNKLIVIRIFKPVFSYVYRNVEPMLPKLYLTKSDITKIKINKSVGEVKITFKNNEDLSFINRNSQYVTTTAFQLNKIEQRTEKFNKQYRQEMVAEALSETILSKLILPKSEPDKDISEFLDDPDKIII